MRDDLPGASSGSRTMAFTVLPPSNATVICVSLVRYAPSCGVLSTAPVAGSTAWIAVLVVVSVIWSVNGSTCHFGAIALPSAHRTMVRRSASAVVAAQVTRIRFTMLRTVRHSSRIRRTWRGKHGIMGNPRNDRNSCAASQCSRAVKQYEIRGKSQ